MTAGSGAYEPDNDEIRLHAHDGRVGESWIALGRGYGVRDPRFFVWLDETGGACVVIGFRPCDRTRRAAPRREACVRGPPRLMRTARSLEGIEHRHRHHDQPRRHGDIGAGVRATVEPGQGQVEAVQDMLDHRPGGPGRRVARRRRRGSAVPPRRSPARSSRPP